MLLRCGSGALIFFLRRAMHRNIASTISPPSSSPGKNPAMTALAGKSLDEPDGTGPSVEGLSAASGRPVGVDVAVAGPDSGVLSVTLDVAVADREDVPVGFADEDEPGFLSSSTREHCPSTQLYPWGQQSEPHLGSFRVRSVLWTGLRGCSVAFWSDTSQVMGSMN